MRKDIDNTLPEQATAAISAAHLLHPAKHFDHPHDVLAAEHLGDAEKRAILSSWASDIFAIESAPGLRLYPGTEKAVSYDEIIDALKSLDKDDRQSEKRRPRFSFDRRRNAERGREPRRPGRGYWKADRGRRPFEI
jgi:hypothetical protein